MGKIPVQEPCFTRGLGCDLSYIGQQSIVVFIYCMKKDILIWREIVFPAVIPSMAIAEEDKFMGVIKNNLFCFFR
jgi:hypothetical protein